jgi:asparagine synthase (glutamine-hydrolysing)
MCRIAGIRAFGKDGVGDRGQYISSMNGVLSHGGPDGEGVYNDDYVSLGHRRLSILDLSEQGKQPMQWSDLVITYNGEIYNFEEIRTELQRMDFGFSSDTDTEVILKAFQVWGVSAVERFRGMFAFAIWEKTTQKLTLCRDRIGAKPLYWYWKDGLFMFASELKAFHEHPAFDKGINQDAVSLFLQQGYIQAPHCIFSHAHKLEPGCMLELNCNADIKIQRYWSAEDVYKNIEPTQKSEGEVLEETEEILRESFELRLVSDVPVGMFLSGGIDSSLVTSMLQKHSNRQLKTFTIGFDDEAHNEAPYARAIADHIGSDHHELYCTENDFLRILPTLSEVYDEPFGDSSAIPTCLVSELAASQVKVSLSADGGDEIWGGYTKYEMYKNFYPKLSAFPASIRSVAAKFADSVSPLVIDKYAKNIPFLRNYANVGNKFFKLRNALMSKDGVDFFNASSSFLTGSELNSIHPHTTPRYTASQPQKEGLSLAYVGMIDIQTYLEGDIMCKVDRAGMHNALEGREPMLDQKIIELGLSIPDTLKMKNGDSKHVLRQILYKYCPQELIDRPKQGFSVPIEKWLRGHLGSDLKEMSEDTEFFDIFHLNRQPVSKAIDDFLGVRSYVNPYIIWFLYTLYQWYGRWMRIPSSVKV